MNTTENNKLIAKFLGLQQKSIKGGFLKNGILVKYDNLKFHNDWNWLMEVVEKIENYNEFTSVLFAPQGCAIDCFVENGFSFSNDCNTKIEATYNACIEFIKWYNEQNK